MKANGPGNEVGEALGTKPDNEEVQDNRKHGGHRMRSKMPHQAIALDFLRYLQCCDYLQCFRQPQEFIMGQNSDENLTVSTGKH